MKGVGVYVYPRIKHALGSATCYVNRHSAPTVDNSGTCGRTVNLF